MYVRRLLLLAAIGAFASSNSLIADVYHPKKVGIGTHDPTERLTLYAGNFALQTADNLEDQSILFQNAELDYTWRIYRTDVDGAGDTDQSRSVDEQRTAAAAWLGTGRPCFIQLQRHRRITRTDR